MRRPREAEGLGRVGETAEGRGRLMEEALREDREAEGG